MTNNRLDPSAATHHLESAVKLSSPAKLRLMLIERGVDVATRLSRRWNLESDEAPGVNEDSVALLDLLTELLAGVTGKEDEVCQQVADLYVFLAKHLLLAEETKDSAAIDEMRLVLEVEAETWRLVCSQQAGARARGQAPGSTQQSGFDFVG